MKSTLIVVCGMALAVASAQTVRIKSFSAGPDQALTYPSGPGNPPYLTDFADEHTTFMPPASAGAPYLIFGASALSGGNSGAVVLQSSDLTNFSFATSLGYNRQVLAAPVPFIQCNPAYQTEFDGNYAAPGSVVQDPTLPPGNLIMIYEAENHCPGGVHNPDFYATVGFARSSDNGKTWPAPINGPNGGPARHPVLQNSIPQPATAHPPLGDAIPSAFVDKSANGDYYLYVVYDDHMGDNTPNRLRIARAKLGTDPLAFLKWNNGAFSEPGIGGADTGFLPSGGCPGSQEMGEITRNDDLGSYVALFVCISGPQNSRVAAWYYSTATSLDLQDWSTPQMVENSQFPVTAACSADGRGAQFDGWYPSSMSPGAPTGHTKLNGMAFYMSGCDTGKRQFMSRTFTITAESVPLISKVANAEGESLTIAPNTWVEIKGSNLSPAGDTRIWQASDFANNRMPTSLDGVSVSVNGKAAYVYYISPTQINILTPPDALPASVQVMVTNNGVASAPLTAQAQPISPSFFVFSDNQHVAAVHASGDLVGAASLSVPGYTFSPARPGEVIEVYANGFGPTSTPVGSGAITQGGTLSALPVVKVGGITATVQFAGLVFPGEFQFNIVIPPNAPGGDQPITATYNGATTQPGTLITTAGAAPPTSVTYYVSPSGNDSWSGALTAPNSANSDGPFATFDRARAAVRSLNKTGLSQVTVQFRGGTYFLPATEQFTAADSGTPALRIVYQNYPGETPVISGGLRVRNWSNVGGNVWKAPLPASTQYFENLFYNGARRLRPRLGGYLGTYLRVASPVYINAAAPPGKAPNGNCKSYVPGSGWECFDRFQYNPKDPIVDTWKNLAPAAGNLCNQPAGNPALAGDIELLNFEQFVASKLRISCVDTANHIVYLTGPTVQDSDKNGFIPGHRYLVENVADALTQPGQWFLDRSTNPWTLTYLAGTGENPNNDVVVVPQLAQVVVASDLQHVEFQGLTFAHDNFTVPAAGYASQELDASITAAVSLQNSQQITFDSNIVTQTSGAGLEILSCIDAQSPAWCVSRNPNAVTAQITVQNSAFYDLGASALRIGEGAKTSDTDASVPQFITVADNVVEAYGRTFPSTFGIAQGAGHDNTYTHNDVYDGYHVAISVCHCAGDTFKPNGGGAFNNTISFNHVYNLEQGIMNDGGSIRVGTGNSVFSAAGNKILNNKVHDVSDASALDTDGYGGNGIYLDNQTGLVDVENNLVYRVSANAINLPQGPPVPNEANIIKNNILAFARQSLINDNNPYPSGSVPPSAALAFVAANNLFYFDRNSASSPAFYTQGGCTYSGGFAYAAFQQWNSNLYWRTDGGYASDAQAFHVQINPGATQLCTGNTSRWTFYTFSDWQVKAGEDIHSVVQNPGFANPTYPADDFSLPKGSPGVGFVPFDSTQAGRTNPVIMPPAIPATFPTKPFNPATDY